MEIANSGEKWNSKLFRILNSAMSFGIAYIILVAGGFLTKGWVAKMYNIKSTVYFHGTHFNAAPKEWYQKNIIIVHSSSLIFVFLTAVLGIIIYKRTSRFDSPLRLIFLWLFVIGVCLFCSQFMAGALGENDHNSLFAVDFAYAIAWLFIKPTIAFIIAGAMFLVMIAASFFLVRPFLILAYSYRKVYHLKSRRKYFFETAMIPCLIGTLFTTTLIFPEKYIFIHFLQSLYLIVAMITCWYLLFYTDVKYDSLLRHTKLEKISFPLILLFISATYLTQTILLKGIKF